MNLKENYLREFLKLGVPVHVIREEEGWILGVKKRCVAKMWIPMPFEKIRGTQPLEIGISLHLIQ